MKKLFLVLLVLVVVGGTAFSFDAKSFPAPIKKGSFLISPTFGIGTYYYSGATLAFIGVFDFALPINFGLTLGGEVGFAMTTYSDWDYGYDYRPFAIPILFRAFWHPNFEVKGLDPYVGMKMGLAIGIIGGDKDYKVGGYGYEYKGRSGFAMGLNVGCRYFFSNAIGVFGELGYDQYWVGVKETSTGPGWKQEWKYYWPMRTFFRTGITFNI